MQITVSKLRRMKRGRVEHTTYLVIFAVRVSIFGNALIHKPLERRKFMKLNEIKLFIVINALKAMLHEAIFLATCNATNAALQVARKN